MMEIFMDRIAYCLSQERSERDAGSRCTTQDERDIHIISAERYADEAWSLNEADPNLPALPSGCW